MANILTAVRIACGLLIAVSPAFSGWYFSLPFSLKSAITANSVLSASHQRRFFIPTGGENTNLFESPQELELKTKSAKLAELDAELNMDQQSASHNQEKQKEQER